MKHVVLSNFVGRARQRAAAAARMSHSEIVETGTAEEIEALKKRLMKHDEIGALRLLVEALETKKAADRAATLAQAKADAKRHLIEAKIAAEARAASEALERFKVECKLRAEAAARMPKPAPVQEPAVIAKNKKAAAVKVETAAEEKARLMARLKELGE